MSEETYPVANRPTPSPEYGPVAVIDRQLAALKDNDTPETDAGIETAYNFASPANRKQTGPLNRFKQMVHGFRYAPLLDHEEAVSGPIETGDDGATQRVTVTGPDGRTVTYEFRVSIATTGRFSGCWMTDAVLQK